MSIALPKFRRRLNRSRASVIVGRLLTTCTLFVATGGYASPSTPPIPVDNNTLGGKVLCGYQGWFRCPGDATGKGWIHWSRDAKRLTPETVTFEMWPDMREYGPDEHFKTTGFTYPNREPATLFSSDNADTVLRHFRWMQDEGIDGIWLQQFAVELPGGPGESLYPSRARIIDHVRAAAAKTGRVWALTYDLTSMPADRVHDAVVNHWKRMVDEKRIDDRYVREQGLPVVEIWGIYPNQPQYPLTPETAIKLFDFFRTPGPYAAYVVGGGDWNWRKTFTPEWRNAMKKMHAWMPWNVANYRTDSQGIRHASTHHWAEDKKACEEAGVTWIPVVYPGFSWANLQKVRGGTNTSILRRGGAFLWDQFVTTAELKPKSVFVAMFDEVDEATAIFKVTSTPPTQATFLGYDGQPSDRYLQLTGEGTRLFRGVRTDRTMPPPR